MLVTKSSQTSWKWHRHNELQSAKREAHLPTTQTELRAFLGLFNGYKRFVTRYSHIAAPFEFPAKEGEAGEAGIIRNARARCIRGP